MAVRGYITLGSGEAPYILRDEGFGYLGNFETFQDAQRAIQAAVVSSRLRYVEENIPGTAGAWKVEDVEAPIALPIALGGNILSLDSRKRTTLSGNQVYLWKDQANRSISVCGSLPNVPAIGTNSIDHRVEINFVGTTLSANRQELLYTGGSVINPAQDFTVTGVFFGLTLPNTAQRYCFIVGRYTAGTVSVQPRITVSVRQQNPSQVFFTMANNSGSTSNCVLNFSSGGPLWFAFMARCEGNQMSIRHNRNPGGVTTAVKPAAPYTQANALVLSRGPGNEWSSSSQGALDFYQRALTLSEWQDQLLPYYEAQFPRCT